MDLNNLTCTGRGTGSKDDGSGGGGILTGGGMNINKEVPLLYTALGRLSDRIDAVVEEAKKAAAENAYDREVQIAMADRMQQQAGAVQSINPDAMVDTMQLQTLQQDFNELRSTWNATSDQWANVQSVLRKFFEQHHAQLQDMHARHQQEVNEKLAPVLAKFDAEQLAINLKASFKEELIVAKRELTEMSMVDRESSQPEMMGQDPMAKLMSFNFQQLGERMKKVEAQIRDHPGQAHSEGGLQPRTGSFEKREVHLAPIQDDTHTKRIDDLYNKVHVVATEQSVHSVHLTELDKKVDLLKGRNEQVDLMKDLQVRSAAENRGEQQKADLGGIDLMLPKADSTDEVPPREAPPKKGCCRMFAPW